MIFFFGVREVARDDGENSASALRCPACGQFDALRPRIGRSYFHIFWIPLLPLGQARHYLRCRFCKARFAPAS